MSGLPSMVVELSADGSSWLDITGYVSLGAGLTCRRGRSSEFDVCSPGTLRFTVDNPTATFWGVGGWFDALYGVVKKNTHVRVTVAGSQAWRGRIDSYRWVPGEAKRSSKVEIEATDLCKMYARARLYPYAIEKYASDWPWTSGAIYPLGGMKVGSYRSPHRDPAGSLMRIVAGSEGGWKPTTDGPPYVKYGITQVPRGSDGPVWEHPTTWSPATQYGMVSVWFRTSNDADVMYLYSMLRTSGGSGYIACWLDGSTGRLTFSIAGDSGGALSTTPTGSGRDNLNDGDWHHLMFWVYTSAGTTYLKYIIDGVSYSASTASSITIGSSNRRGVFGGQRSSAWTAPNAYVWDGDLAAPAVFTYSTWVNATTWYDYGMTGDTGSTVATRANDLADFVGAAHPTKSNMTGYTLGGQDTDGKSLLDALQEIANAELGVFYIDRLGAPQLRGHDAYTATGTVVTGGLSATEDLAGDLELLLDDATYANYVRASGPNGDIIKYDSTLVASDGAPLIDEWSTIGDDETEVGTQATRRLTRRKDSTPRLSRVTVDLLTTPNSIATQVLTLVPLDRVEVNDLDSDLSGATTYAGFVEGWELTVSDREYSVKLDLSPDIF